MLPNAFIGRTGQPSDGELAAVLGAGKALWDRLLDELAAELRLVVREWNSYSRKAGWSLRVKLKERNVVYLSPHHGCFTASFALGDKAVQRACAGSLPPRIVKLIRDAKRYAEGTAVRIEVSGPEDIAVVKELASIKLAN